MAGDLGRCPARSYRRRRARTRARAVKPTIATIPPRTIPARRRDGERERSKRLHREGEATRRGMRRRARAQCIAVEKGAGQYRPCTQSPRPL